MDRVGWSEEGKNLMLSYAREHISHLGLHSDVPAAENELPEGVYRRRQIDLREPRGGELRSDRKIVLDVPEGARPTHAGFWTSPFGGVLLAGAALTKSREFKGDGTVEIDLATLDLHLDGGQ